MYGLKRHTELMPLQQDGIARMKRAYLEEGPERSNLAYGYVMPT
jgi:hypothetical protein